MPDNTNNRRNSFFITGINNNRMMTEYEQEEHLSILAAIVCIIREKNKSKALFICFSKRADESHNGVIIPPDHVHSKVR